jgi:hypothetical protein
MSGYSFPDLKDARFAPADFDVRDLQDEIRVDGLCRDLLGRFCRDLAATGQLSPAAAGALAHGADYFLREFVIPDRHENLFRLKPGRVRQFGGNWYIVRNVEPNLAELTQILRGVEAFYDWCLGLGLVGAALAAAVRSECAQHDFYARRIEAFWAITGDGYEAWERECTLRDR